MQKIKPEHLYYICGILLLLSVFVTVYNYKKIDDDHPSYVKEFLDNPDEDMESKLCGEVCVAGINAKIMELTTKIAVLEAVNSTQTLNINNNNSKIITMDKKFVKSQKLLDNAGSELEMVAMMEAPTIE